MDGEVVVFWLDGEVVAFFCIVVECLVHEIHDLNQA